VKSISFSFLLYFLATGIARGAPLILMPFYLNLLSVSTYSSIILITLIGKILSRFINLAGGTTLLYETKQDHKKATQILSVYNTASIIVFVVFCLLLGLISVFMLQQNTLLLCLVFGFSEAIFGLKSSYFRSVEASPKYFYLSIARFLIELLAIVIVSQLTLNVAFYFSILSLLQIIICLPLSWSIPSLELWNVLKQYRYVLAFMPNAIFGWIINSSDRFIVKFISGDLALIKYSIGYNLSSLLLLVTATLAVWLPAEISNHFELWSKKTRFYRFVRQMLVLAILVLIFEGFILFIDERFFGFLMYYDIDIYLVLVFATLGIFFTAINAFTSAILIYLKRTKEIFWVNLFISILNIVLNIVLINQLGYLGAAISTAICFFLLFIVVFLLVRGKMA